MPSIFGDPIRQAGGRTEVSGNDISHAILTPLSIAPPLNTSTNVEGQVAESQNHHSPDTSTEIPPQPPIPPTQPSAPRTSLFSKSTQHLLQSNNLNYNFRQGANRYNFKGTGFIDHDTSGDYDPDKEKRKKEYSERQNRNRKTIPEENENDGEALAVKRRNRGSRRYEQGRKNGCCKIIILPATEEKIRDYLELKAVEDLENRARNPRQPNGWRSRRGAHSLYEKIDGGLWDDSEEDEYLVGHPIARGCKRCRMIGKDCSLINDPLNYPCEDCTNDDFDVCIPIIPPRFKKPCENCRNEREYCSYGNDYGINVSSCVHCLAAGKTCIAGAAKSMRMDDVLAELELQKAKGSNVDRKILACTPCRKRKINCSLKSKDDTERCRACRIEDVACTFENIPKTQRAPKEKLKKTRDSTGNNCIVSANPGKGKKSMGPPSRANGKKQESREKKQKKQKREKTEKRQYVFTYSPSPSSCSTSSTSPNDPVHHGQIRATITTAFCHPIIFNYQPPNNAPKYPLNAFSSFAPTPPLHTCHFCHPGIPYALFGLGNRRVVVTRWAAGDGWDEESGGWSSEGAEATRVCKECTLERIIITSCTEHRIRRIKGLDVASFDMDKPLLSVVQRWKDTGATDEAGRWLGLQRVRKEDEVKWCSVCPAPAFYECCSADQHDPDRAARNGCGLLLCDVCADMMCPKADWGRDGRVDGKGIKEVLTLDKLIHHASYDRTNYPDRLRADVGFLLKDGEMMRRLDATLPEEMEIDSRAWNWLKAGDDVEMQTKREKGAVDDDDELEIKLEPQAVVSLAERGGRKRVGNKEAIDLTESDDEEGNGGERKETSFVDLSEEWEQWDLKVEDGMTD